MRLPRQPKALPISTLAIERAKESFPPRTDGGKNIVVFCSAKFPKKPVYGRHALALGNLIGERGHNLIWGGTDAGTMKMVSAAAKAHGAHLLGVGFGGAKDGNRNSKADAMFAARTIAERKDAMLDLGHVAIALAGGIGTVDEIATVLERKKAFDPLPPMILLNSGGYYNGLMKQIEVMDREGFIFDGAQDLVRLAETPEEAIELAETLEPQQFETLLSTEDYYRFLLRNEDENI